MATLNKICAEAMAGLAHGCTDITGFGLLGHGHEMAMGSGTTIRLHSKAIAILAEALDFANMGMIPEGGHKNLNFYQQWLRSSLPDKDVLHLLLADPQTSGGLLIAAAPAEMAQIQAAIASTDYGYDCAIIGEVIEGEPGIIELE